jgi:lambda repressor-like predicted transcriptional regulator
MKKNVSKVLSAWLDITIPKDSAHGELQKLAKEAGLSPGTLKSLRSRQSFSASTIVSLLLARGVSEQSLTNLTMSEKTKVSTSLNEWNKLGLILADKQRNQFLDLIQYLIKKWNVK